MYCSKCGKKVNGSQRYCDDCGSKIAMLIKCNSCGTLLPQQCKFCVNCGNELNNIPDIYRPDIDTDVLTERLKEYRIAMATVENIPAYCIFDNKTLEAIVNVMPTELEHFNYVKGFSYNRIKKYGNDVIEIVKVLDRNDLTHSN